MELIPGKGSKTTFFFFFEIKAFPLLLALINNINQFTDNMSL